MLGGGGGICVFVAVLFVCFERFCWGGGGRELLHRMEGTEFLFYHFIKRYFVST